MLGILILVLVYTCAKCRRNRKNMKLEEDAERHNTKIDEA